jgi:hypothetical protein
MDMLRACVAICFAFLLAAHSSAQLEIKAGVRTRLDNATGLVQVGNRVYITAGSIGGTTRVGLFQISTKADLSKVRISVRDSSLNPFEPTKIDDVTYEIPTPGKWLIRASVTDFDNKIAGEDEKLLEFSGSDPSPPPDPGPNPPPSPVPDAYGIGAIAYQYAPKDRERAAKIAAIYKQCGDFLFGMPSLKFITSSNDAHNNDPNRSIHAWRRQQLSLVQCTDQETCKAWEIWKIKVDEAIRSSQTKRQYTRQEWYSAINEVAKALEVSK